MMQVPLNPGIRGGRSAYLRPICGLDEAFVDGTDFFEAVAFLDRLLVEAPGTTVGPGRASELTVCDFDRLFANIYLQYFGKRIESTATCRGCGNPFDLSIDFPNLIRHLDRQTERKATGPDEEGIYSLPDGRRFRLPTIGDQQSVTDLETDRAVDELLERCMVEGDPRQGPELVQAAMEDVGPVVDFDLDAACPECGETQTVRFEIQAYLLRTLAHEKRFLNHEVHRIAMAYGWGYEEILSLTREDRRSFVRLIETDHAARRPIRA